MWEYRLITVFIDFSPKMSCSKNGNIPFWMNLRHVLKSSTGEGVFKRLFDECFNF